MSANHLQFIHHDELFDSKELAIEYINSVEREWKMGEPLVVKFTNDDGVEEVLFAIGNGNGFTLFDPSDGGSTEEIIGRIINGVGLNADGTYKVDSDDKILSSATNIANAEKLLSDAITYVGFDAIVGVSNSGTPIELSVVTDGETNKKLVTGDVKIVNTKIDGLTNYNILKKVSLDSGDPTSQQYLYVRGTADNIIYGGDNASLGDDTSVEDALDSLYTRVDDLDKKIDDTNIKTEDTETVTLHLDSSETGQKDVLSANVKISSANGNQIKVYRETEIEEGIYHNISFDYSSVTNKLSVLVNGIKTQEIQLVSVSFIKSIDFDQETQTFIITYVLSTGEEMTIEIPLGDLLQEWDAVSSNTLTLVRDKSTNPNVLSGNVRIVDSQLIQYKDNILVATSNGLFVNGSGITKNAEDIAAEKTARESADNIITENLNTEATTREENDNKIAESAGFDSSYTYVQDRNTNYIADAVSLADADKKLDTAIGVVSGKSDANADDIAFVSGVTDTISGKLDTTIVGAGLAEDGTYIINHDAKYLNHAESLADADNKLDTALSELSEIVAKNELVVNDSTSINFELDTTSDKTILDGNVIVSQKDDNNITVIQTVDDEKGLYSKAELSYDENSNTITFTNTNGSISYVLAGITEFIEEIRYDPTREVIIIKYISKGETKTLEIPIGDMIEEWDVSQHNISGDSLSYGIIMRKERNVLYNKDILSARIQTSDKTDNMVEFDNGKLYVSNSGITKNTEDIALISGKTDSIESEIAFEREERINADGELGIQISINESEISNINETIGDGFSTSETQTVTYKYNTLSSNVETNRESIETLNEKVETISGQVKDNSFIVESTNSVNLTKTEYSENPDVVSANVKVSSSPNNNLNVNGDGLYTKSVLNYDAQNNKLSFETNNGTKEIVLSGTSLVTNNVDHNVDVNIADSVITADVKVANNGKYGDNIIEIVSTTLDGKQPALYVNPSGITKNTEDIAIISGNVETISDNLDAEIARATAKEAELEAEIGEIKTYEVGVNDTDTIDLETSSALTPSGIKETISANAKFSDANNNIVKNNNGIYAKVGLSFNENTNDLVFETTNGTTNISLESLAEDLTPNNASHTTNISIVDKEISADVVIASGDNFNDNMLKVVTTTQEGGNGSALYVSPSAITKNASDISTISGVVDSIVTSASTLDTKIDNEVERATAKENALDTKIDNEVERATAKENALDAKIDEVSGEIKSYKVNVETTNTVTLSKTETTTSSGTETNLSADVNLANNADNIVKDNNGIYAKVDLSFDSRSNNLVLTTTNGDKNVSLQALSLSADNDTHNVNIDIANQKISADVAVATQGNYSDNMLSVVYTTDDNKNPALYVNPSAVTRNANEILNVKANVNTLSGTLDTAVSNIATLRTDVNTISGNVTTVSGLANTNKANIETVSSIAETNKATIGTGFTDTEGNTVTAKFNNLVGRVDTHDTKISALEQFSANTNASIGTINTQLSNITSQTQSLQQELDRTELGAGLTTDGNYEPNTSTNYLKTAQSLKNADEMLDANLYALSGKVGTDEQSISALSGAITSVDAAKQDKFGVNDTNSIALTMTVSEENGNVLIADSKIDPDIYNNLKITPNGLYSKFGLDYDAASNTLTYIDKDGPHDIHLNSGSIIDSIEYDAENKVLIITYKTSTSSEAQTVTVPISDLNSVRVQDGNHLGGIQLTATTESGVTVISASTVISNDSTNILVNDNGVLKVDGVSNNILYSKDEPNSGSVFTVINSLITTVATFDQRIRQMEETIESLVKRMTIVSSETDTDIVTSEITLDGYTKINVVSKTATAEENLIDVNTTEVISDNGIYFDGSQDNGKF